ncbi:MAG: DUF4160 domain-containing protein [Sphingobacteriales bacterium]|jgi:hypothetical protein|nr:DUF4160 domain-containing protein [Sphingobacteriales bacterium]
MPTVLTSQGFRFFFWSNENDEPMHVHVEKADGEGKIWLEPIIKFAYMHGFTPKEQKQIMKIITDNFSTFKQNWNEHFAE